MILTIATLVLLNCCLRHVAALVNCDDVVADSALFIGTCDNKWKNLKPLMRPTQAQVGYAWIAYKLKKDFTSSSNAQKEMDSSVTPVVLGPGPAVYIVDDHHTLSALDYSGYSDTKVTLNIICDKRSVAVEEFWRSLQSENLAYLAAHPVGKPDVLPTPITYSQLPSTFSFTDTTKSLSDDPWRSLAGYSRKVNALSPPAQTCSSSDDSYCERCMFRGCSSGGGGVSYFEFRWAYFMNDATFYNTKYWTSSSDLNSFKALYAGLGSSATVSKVDVSQWQSAAVYVVPLCRSAASGSYSLPATIFPGSSALPGYVSGYGKLTKDPDCSAPTCV